MNLFYNRILGFICFLAFSISASAMNSKLNIFLDYKLQSNGLLKALEDSVGGKGEFNEYINIVTDPTKAKLIIKFSINTSKFHYVEISERVRELRRYDAEIILIKAVKLPLIDNHNNIPCLKDFKLKHQFSVNFEQVSNEHKDLSCLLGKKIFWISVDNLQNINNKNWNKELNNEVRNEFKEIINLINNKFKTKLIFDNKFLLREENNNNNNYNNNSTKETNNERNPYAQLNSAKIKETLNNKNLNPYAHLTKVLNNNENGKSNNKINSNINFKLNTNNNNIKSNDNKKFKSDFNEFFTEYKNLRNEEDSKIFEENIINLINAYGPDNCLEFLEKSLLNYSFSQFEYIYKNDDSFLLKLRNLKK